MAQAITLPYNTPIFFMCLSCDEYMKLTQEEDCDNHIKVWLKCGCCGHETAIIQKKEGK